MSRFSELCGDTSSGRARSSGAGNGLEANFRGTSALKGDAQ